MATSGSIDFSATVSDLITEALELIGVKNAGESVSAEDTSITLRTFNLRLKHWANLWPDLFRQTAITQALSGATASYTLAARANDILDCRYRNASGIETPMIRLTREEYDELPDKATAGIPTQYYYDRQRATGVLYVWPVLATVTTESLRLTVWRTIEDADATTNDMDFPAEYLHAVALDLASNIAPKFGIPLQEQAALATRASQAMAEAMAADREGSVYFMGERG